MASSRIALVPPTSPYLLLSPWLAPDLTHHGVEVREVGDAAGLAVAERVLAGLPDAGA